MAEPFDWNDNEAIVVRRQEAIAVYANPDADVVIRQEAPMHQSEDVWIVIPRKEARRVIEAMERVLREATADRSDSK